MTLKTGLEAFQSSPEFGGPVEQVDGHHCNDHFAQIYEFDEERFATAVPFVRHGLTHDEQVVYVVEPHREPEVRAALRDGGIDVDAAVERGQLTFYTADETYLRNDSFDPAGMHEFYADTVAAATEDYRALRLVAETSWLDPEAIPYDRWMEYEARVNQLFDTEDCVALCQYDRNQFPPEFIQNIVRSHPHLIYDGAVCHNVYYTPPAEVFDDDPARETDRMLATLRDRAEAKTDLQQRDHFLRRLHEITSDSARGFEAKLNALFDLGREQFGLDIGGLSKVNPETDLFEVEYLSGDHDHLEPGARTDLSETYCRLVTEDGETTAVTDPVDAGFEGNVCYEEFGVQSYLGTHFEIDGGMDRTFWFVSTEPRVRAFTDEEHTLVHLMSQWVQYELERRQRERELERTKTRFETVFEQSTDAIFLIDSEADDLVAANSAAADMLGYARDELESLTPSDLHPDELEQFHAFLDEVQESGSVWSEDLHCRHHDGRDLPAEVSASAITLDGRDLVLANVRHIEERKIHERYQRDLYDIIADSRTSFDEKLNRLLDLGRDRFGLENGYFTRIDADADEFEIVAAVGPHNMIEAGATDALSGTFCEAHLNSGEPLAAADVVDAGLDHLRAHEEYGVNAYFAATVHVSGDEYGTLGFASDSSRQKPFTEAERTFLDLMAQCLGYELERTRREEQLERKNDRLESFASLLAHELRNPVTIGQIYGQRLSTDKAPDADTIEYMTEAFDRIENMVDVMLVLTRGREAVDECSSVNLGDATREAWADVDAPAADLDVELARTTEADETYMRHLFHNLLQNAVEHAGPDVAVEVGDLSDGGGFYVADDGPGVPPEDRNAVFDEGYTTAADSGGIGLGLAFVQKLAEVYEWDIEITESEDGGARFEFRNVT